MSQEEEKILKDLVTQSLASKGFLGKIQAEIRAGVFVALEDQDVLKDININKPLKDFIETTHGALIISLVREFLEFFNLHFTNMVFDPETHAGIDYKFEGRKKLATDLNLSSRQDANVPLLGLLLQSLDLNCSNNAGKGTVNGFSPSDKANDNKITKSSMNDSLANGNNECDTGNNTKMNASLPEEQSDKLLDLPKEGTLFSLSDLPLPENTSNSDYSPSKIDMKQLNELLEFQPDEGDGNYEEDFVSSGSDKKDKTDSTESEIEEELPTNSNHSNGDDLTADITISKESGQGDYTEKLSNS